MVNKVDERGKRDEILSAFFPEQDFSQKASKPCGAGRPANGRLFYRFSTFMGSIL